MAIRGVDFKCWNGFKVDFGNGVPEKTSVEPKVSEEGLLDAIQQDYFPSASIESFELPLSESKRVRSEGKLLVIIDDYIGCSKYFDSGKVDVKIFQEFQVLEMMESGNKESQKKNSLEEFDSEHVLR
ncbi:hypothetical protein RchiOBHm_Chr2g0101351 [Rosa chinensis]|uniref:Uncharacterized protein n=1 Tax=Rosa chinensis TaxID=74649 RepID=A0A2P6RME3_ROSCH|nr:hypothetical protein RchiOBHm_Chr2g0101351 [Rosa chinensis]